MKIPIPIQVPTNPKPPQVGRCRHCNAEFSFTADRKPPLPMCWRCSASAMEDVEQVSPGRYRVKQPRDFSKPFGGSRR